MKHVIALLVILVSFMPDISAQNNAQRYIEVAIKNNEALPNAFIDQDGLKSMRFNNDELNKLLSSFKIVDFVQAYPSAANFDDPLVEKLLKVYHIFIDDNIDDLYSLLNHNYRDYYENVYLLEQPKTFSIAFYPNDPLDNSSNLYRLESVFAQEAWIYSKGNSNSVIGVVECCLGGFDVNHQDLSPNISGWIGALNWGGQDHGTNVAGLASASTDNGIGISSIGFNTKMILAAGSADPYDLMLDAVASGATIINHSWGGVFYSQSQQDCINLVNNQNVVVVASAGNGLFGNNCLNSLDPDCYRYPASYDNVISVSGVTGFSTNKDFIENSWCCSSGGSSCLEVFTHNDKVDVLASAFCNYTTDVNNSYNFASGTSTASPIVAGLIGLMQSINPCQTPLEISNILVDSGDDVSNVGNNSTYYTGTVPPRVNALEAVKESIKGSSIYLKDIDIYNSQVHAAYYGVFAGDDSEFAQETGYTILHSGSNVTLNAGEAVFIGGDFEVKLGAELTVNITPQTCN